MTHNFTRKKITANFTIALPDGSTDTLTLAQDYRIQATIKHTGMESGSDLTLHIKGLTPHDMNHLSYIPNSINPNTPTRRNPSHSTITLCAGDYNAPLATVFVGNITESFASYEDGSPTLSLHALTTTKLAAIIPPARSYHGAHSTLSILSNICSQAGLTLVDHGGWGRHATINNHYGDGTALDHIRDIIHHTGGVFDYTPATNSLHVWGPTYSATPTQQNAMPVISTQNGMVGYPKYSKTGVRVTTLFQPDIKFLGTIKIDSHYLPAGWSTNTQGLSPQGQKIGTAPWHGTWIPYFIQHDLSTETPNGSWFTQLECQRT